MKLLSTLLLFLFIMPSLTQAQNSWTKLSKSDVYGIWNANVYCYKEGLSYYYTDDDGATSTELGISPGFISQVGQVFFLSKEELFVCIRSTSSVAFYSSTDAGASFTEMSSSIMPVDFSAQGAPRLFFFNSMEGLADVRTISGGGDVVDIMLRTADGGATWAQATNDPLELDGPLDIVYNANGTVRVYGDDHSANGIHESTDKGATWSVVGSNPLSSGEFTDDGGQNIWGVGWAGSNEPCYVSSTDGGATFNAWTLPAPDNGGIIACENAATTARGVERVGQNLMVRGYRESAQDIVTILSTDMGQTWEDVTFPDGEEASTGFIGVTQDGLGFSYVLPTSDAYVFGAEEGGVGMEEKTLPRLQVYPNPVTEVLNIRFDNLQSGLVEIYSIQGTLLHTQRVNGPAIQVSTDFLTPGLYSVIMKDNDGQMVAQNQIVKATR